MATNVFPKAKKKFMEGGINLASDTIRMLAVTAAYTYDSADEFVADLSGEVTVANYARVTLGSKTVTVSGANCVFDAADPTPAAFATGETVAAWIVYKFVTNDADSPVIAYVDGTDKATNGNTFTTTFNASGIFGL